MSAHVYPNVQHHVTTGYRCWCNPTIYRVCPECDGEGVVTPEPEDEADAAWMPDPPAVDAAPARCWRCRDSLRVGLLPLSYNEAVAVDGTEQLIVVHHKCSANDVLPAPVPPSDDAPAQDYDEDAWPDDGTPADDGDDDGMASAGAGV